jgi:hypothetical protein
VDIELSPLSLSDGGSVTVRFEGMPGDLAGRVIEVQLAAVDDVACSWLVSLANPIAEDGSWNGHVQLAIGRELACLAWLLMPS